MGTITQDHKLMVSASNCHRIMTCLDKDYLPQGAISYISDMFNLSDDDFENTYMSADMNNGVEKEPEAIEELAAHLWLDIKFTGHAQKRLYAGKDYYDFLSALTDGIISCSDVAYTVEVKCLNRENHQSVCENVRRADDLKKYDYPKYCQVQAQILCAENSFKKKTLGIIAFYNENCKEPLRIIWIDPDQEWRDRLHSRLGLAKKLYLEIQGEPQKQVIPLAPDNEIAITPDIVSLLLGDPKFLMEMVYEHFGVSIVDGHYTGGDIIDCSTKKGRDQAIKLRSKITKVRTGAVSISKKLVEEYKLKCKQELEFRKTIEADCKALSDYLCQALNTWEAEQKKNVEVKKKEIEKEVKADKDGEKIIWVLDTIKNMFEAGKIGIDEALMMAYQAGLDT